MKDRIKQVIIWGHKLHSHTHSYIHNGFYRAFNYLGYKTYWFDNNDNIKDFNFNNSLFITEGQVDTNIPINHDSFYVLHNCNMQKYETIPKNRKITLQVYTYDCDRKYNLTPVPDKKYTFYQDNCIVQPWATDLLPEEINKNLKKLDDIKIKNTVNFVGMLIEPWDEFKKICEKYKIEFKQYGGFNKNNVSIEENIKLTKESIISPALQNKWQVENGYIPCRIFKNISYGKMGATNNIAVKNLFNNEIIYDENIENIILKSLEFEKKKNKNELIIKLMKEVRVYHTYLNRIDTILWFLNKNFNEN